MSAARSAIVMRLSCSSLTLRDTRCCNILSVARSREKLALNISKATPGLPWMKRRKSARDRTDKRASSATFAFAERCLPSMIAISPKKSPCANSASTISFSSSSATVMRTRPLSMRYIASPLSPARNSVVPVGICLVRNSVRNSSAAPSSSDENSGTERIASSVMAEGLCVDMASTSHDLFIERLNQ